MSIEIRDGILCVFMPPVEKLEDYLELVTAVEATAEEMQMQVHVEGYPPPYDPRVEVIKVTPDPGVIEINIQPGAELARGRRHHAAASMKMRAQTRLGADKFLVDGRHTGTGGGNHVVVGGATPAGLAVPAPAGSAEEPRAVLAAASVAVLSVLRHVHRADQPGAAHRRGAGTTGSTNWRSRWRRCRRPDVEAPLWLVDRLFRHILVDITGNTHRAEICIDKLYSPDGATGRLGLVEFRALEMPPDPRMSWRSNC